MYSWQLSKKFTLPKNGSHFEFSNFAKNGKKHKFVSIFLTMRDRAISSKFSTHRVSKKCTIGNFQIFLSPKMAPILNFRIFAKNGKTQICFYLLNRARLSDFVETFYPQGISANYSLQFSKKFPLPPKMAAILNFQSFAKNPKTQICFYLLNRVSDLLLPILSKF